MGWFDDIKKMLGLGNEASTPQEQQPPIAPAKPTSPAQPLQTPSAKQMKPAPPPQMQSAKSISQADRLEFAEIVQQSIADHLQYPAPFYNIKISKLPTYQNTVKNWDDKKRIDFLLYCCQEIHRFNQTPTRFPIPDDYGRDHGIWVGYLQHLLKAKLAIDDEDFHRIYQTFNELEYNPKGSLIQWPIAPLLRQIVTQYEGRSISKDLNATLSHMREKLESIHLLYGHKERSKMLEMIDKLLFSTAGSQSVKPVKFLGEDEFGYYANSLIEQLLGAEQQYLYPIIALAQTATGSKPSTKYLASAKKLVAALSIDAFKEIVDDWLRFILQMKEKTEEYSTTYNGQTHTWTTAEFLSDINTEVLKGLVWMYCDFNDSASLQLIADLADRCFKKIPSKGAASPALGNACLFVLFKSEGLEGIGHLSRLKLRVKQVASLALIDKYLAEAAKLQGVSTEEIEDLVVNDFGLVDGKRSWQYDDYAFEFELLGPGKSSQQWVKPDGSIQKSEPASLKEKHATELKAMKLWIKQVDQASVSQRDRIDRMFRSARKMQRTYFETQYLQHGLLSCIAKKILWRFESSGRASIAMWSSNGWADAQGMPVDIAEDCTVSLWHPAMATPAEVKAWRDYLIANELQQPFKQAFREIYLLTEAEINTRTYSNRMAAHVLKQHQFASLAKGRGWKYDLRGGFDSGTEPMATIKLPDFELKAEYWVIDTNSDAEMSAAGIWTYIVTDQVRFISTTTGRQLELIDIPAIPFSEIMRDVDLFVGVASVGNDPAWQDSGANPAYFDYWHNYSFGNLGEFAKVRKEILESLIPRLKIKKVASISGNYLVVQGKLRTYKIHIGSANILMEPNDQYLCIVPDRGTKTGAEGLFLPFEGDNGLSLVLSKAFLLAEDDKITDGTITSQIMKK